jgi:hypothetical protein
VSEAREQRLLAFDLNDSTKERIGDARVQAYPKIDAALAAMTTDGWRVANVAAGYGNWIYIVVERAADREIRVSDHGTAQETAHVEKR